MESYTLLCPITIIHNIWTQIISVFRTLKLKEEEEESNFSLIQTLQYNNVKILILYKWCHMNFNQINNHYFK